MGAIVYHYTSPQGAFSILRNTKLWFTDCQYLNDVSEFIYILEPLKEAYGKICRERGENIDEIDALLEDQFRHPYDNMDLDRRCWPKKGMMIGFPPMLRYYVLCASMNEDTANMWNYYVKDGAYRGYNLGLDSGVFEEWFSKHADVRIKLESGEVIYDYKRQVELLYNELRVIFDQYDTKIRHIDDAADDSLPVEEFQDSLFDLIHKNKLFFKNPALESEKEYRFVLKAHNDLFGNTDNKYLQTEYRMGTSGIVTPYIEWNFGDIAPDLLKQITLSPMMEPGLAEFGLKRFLGDDIYRCIEIKQSRIKLRF